MSAYSDLVLATSGLVSYWRLGEASGNALDSKGSSPGTVGGTGITRAVTGLLISDADKAIQGDGTTGLVTATVTNPTATFSLEFWCKPATTPTGIRAIGIGRFSPSQVAFDVFIGGANGYQLRVRDANLVDTSLTFVAAPAANGKRDHVVVTYNAAGSIKLYVNGVASTDTPSRTPNANVLNQGASFFIFTPPGGATTGFNGVIDDVSLYNTVLTPQQVLDHFGADAIAYSDTPSGTIRLLGGIAVESCTVVRPGDWGGWIRELPPLRHSIGIVTPTGRRYRWAEDEPLPENTFSSLRFGSTMPGGYDSMDCVLPRRAGVTYNDLERLSTIQVMNAGGKVVGEYRLERTPQISGDQLAISPSAVGWQAHLDDNKGVSIIFLDRELGDWGDISRARTVYLTNAGYNPVGAPSAMSDVVSGLPALDLGWDDPGSWPATTRPIMEAMYDAGPGNLIGRIRATWASYGAINPADGNWVLNFYTNVTGDLGGSASGTGDIFTGAQGPSGNVEVVDPLPRRFGAIQWFYPLAGGVANSNNRYGLYVTNMRVIGDHNLTIRGVEFIGTAPKYEDRTHEGFFASDLLTYSIAKWCPLLRVTAGSIQATNFIIPQAKFKDHTAVSEIVNQSTRYGLEDWAVWNDRTFYLSPRNAMPNARKWRARIGPARLEQTGQQMDRLWESILVQFTDVDGSNRVVGPPGSGVDVEDSRLKDADPTNPANVLGIPRRDKLVMGTSTIKGAIEVGRRFLEEQKLVDRSGRASLVGHVEDDRGVLHAYSDVRAGDAISFVDAADTSYRRIVRVSHDHASRTASVDLDAPPEGLQAVLERLGVILVPLGL